MIGSVAMFSGGGRRGAFWGDGKFWPRSAGGGVGSVRKKNHHISAPMSPKAATAKPISRISFLFFGFAGPGGGRFDKFTAGRWGPPATGGVRGLPGSCGGMDKGGIGGNGVPRLGGGAGGFDRLIAGVRGGNGVGVSEVGLVGIGGRGAVVAGRGGVGAVGNVGGGGGGVIGRGGIDGIERGGGAVGRGGIEKEGGGAGGCVGVVGGAGGVIGLPSGAEKG